MMKKNCAIGGSFDSFFARREYIGSTDAVATKR